MDWNNGFLGFWCVILLLGVAISLELSSSGKKAASVSSHGLTIGSSDTVRYALQIRYKWDTCRSFEIREISLARTALVCTDRNEYTINDLFYIFVCC